MENLKQESKKDNRLVISVIVAILIHPLIGALVIMLGALFGANVVINDLNSRLLLAVFPSLIVSVYFVNLIYERKKRNSDKLLEK